MLLVRSDNYRSAGEILGSMEMKVTVGSKLSKRKCIHILNSEPSPGSNFKGK